MKTIPFSSFDPLLLLPSPPRSGLLVGPDRGHDALAQGYGAFERSAELAEEGPPADAIVALEWRASLPLLVERATARLAPGGVLLARVPNRHLLDWLARRLYPELDPARGAGTSLRLLRRTLDRAGFSEREVYCWLPSDSFPYVAFPVHERRMQRFFLEQLRPKWGWKGRLFGSVGHWLPPTALAPCFLFVARKGGGHG